MTPSHRQVTDELTQLRGEGSEAAVEQAAEVEREFEKDLAKNGSDERIEQLGYNPEDLRKAHRSAPKKKADSFKKKKRED